MIFKWIKEKKKKKAEALRTRCIDENAALTAIDKHWADADILLRQVDAKDSIYELERFRKEVLSEGAREFESVLDSIFITLKSKKKEASGSSNSAKSEKAYAKSRLKEMEAETKGLEDLDCLKRMYYSITTMDMYKRHNKALRKQIHREHRDAYFKRRELRARIKVLEDEILDAKRKRWCTMQARVWEPTQLEDFEPKPLRLEDPKAPKSTYADAAPPPLLDCGGIVRLVSTVADSSQKQLVVSDHSRDV